MTVFKDLPKHVKIEIERDILASAAQTIGNKLSKVPKGWEVTKKISRNQIKASLGKDF